MHGKINIEWFSSFYSLAILYILDFAFLVPRKDAPTDNPCGPNQPLLVNGSISGELTSPNYPSSYPNNAICQWLIRRDVDITSGDVGSVEITILEFDLEYG